MTGQNLACRIAALGMLGCAAVSGAAPARAATGSLPPALRPALYRALATSAKRSTAIGTDGCAKPSGTGLKACFGVDGIRLSGPGAPGLALRFAAYGRGSRLSPVARSVPKIAGNAVDYAHRGITEWWRVLPIGIEQGFTVAARPEGGGPLKLALAANRGLAAHGDALGWGRLRYGGLVVTDARGHTLPATLRTRGKRVLIVVNDARAVYPLTVDPLVWIAQKTTAGDGAADDEFGWSVAISGNAALVGAPLASVNGTVQEGAVYAFAESGGVWTQTQKLAASDGANGDLFGFSAALDGTTAFVGAPGATVGGFVDEGAVYVFTLSGGVWTQRAKLTRNSGLANSEFGYSVALGNGVGVVGGYTQQHAAYVFTGSGGAWVQSAILTPSDGTAGDGFGNAVALAGTTALVGAWQATVNGNADQGAAYVFTDSGGLWTQSAKLVAGDGTAGDRFGASVALGDGTAFAAAPYAAIDGNGNNGAVYVFTGGGTSWNETEKITPVGGTPGGLFGLATAVSGDQLLVGAPFATIGQNGAQGAAFAFGSANGTWTQEAELSASDGAANDEFGAAVAVDADAAVDAVGAFGATVGGNTAQGATYFHGFGDLALSLSAPTSVAPGDQYTSQSILTNNSGVDSAAATLAIPVPTGTSYVSSGATQGSCSLAAGTVTCLLGSLAAGGGHASANVTLKATGNVGDTIANSVGLVAATPSLTAQAPTTITSGGGGGGGGGSVGGGGGGTVSPPVLALLAFGALLALTRRRRRRRIPGTRTSGRIN